MRPSSSVEEEIRRGELCGDVERISTEPGAGGRDPSLWLLAWLGSIDGVLNILVREWRPANENTLENRAKAFSFGAGRSIGSGSSCIGWAFHRTRSH